jgi:hypothetical protein
MAEPPASSWAMRGAGVAFLGVDLEAGSSASLLLEELDDELEEEPALACAKTEEPLRREDAVVHREKITANRRDWDLIRRDTIGFRRSHEV